MTISLMLKDGISPLLRNATDDLVKELESTLQKAKDKGVPLGLLVGALELVKVDVINSF